MGLGGKMRFNKNKTSELCKLFQLAQSPQRTFMQQVQRQITEILIFCRKTN
jgi:hypothetical protein